ncbi:MAG: S23 ribosomal protein, nonfunctional [Candidatus Nomurabacteria bacterium GW2011_GWE1_32_28]|uniref:S23 ribosomal protein, nonfunctional n=1 Tax=Candidatus Nomurabacteria bacterium GW2011_GWF1_31_48 TaxID=1618767 RepID=A0A0G0BH61_9BACT|nr:MAG: S23 ribosomal protein, nonfunctional [Candidatus Nomurabacteria bacterium GW2011_GWF2_30_133]KKP28799.1 MAG: S23 ribosomal protein, nonfunctional [Candidatus Nomurabacteria bacterium GW2011_GWE2_31_40]KKP30377.1 MAG: S23 ribosomal protein, nonfunctional [Candidatus Nomurabacteria bacterium GW2011_GWF1_31_48]KKP34904.1 MAG: S23 ribosomal protein, nonfunctional [Candidatus Nomurabacteria bacterium GW2011_GWE1_32_28]HAS80996.1 four helix bundle protein [Candidatus Nomurabacteria bacterium]
MKIEKFEDIIAWKKGKELTLLVYSVFKTCKDFSFKNQIERASVSIMNNIAEGFERRTNKELRNFLFIAKGSTGETRSMLDLGLELKYIHEKDFKIMYNLSIEISKLLSGFIKSLD